jgi:integrase
MLPQEDISIPYSISTGAYVAEEALASPEARRVLSQFEKPFRLRLRQSQALVYRIRRGGGVWHLQARSDHGRLTRMIGIADDVEPADGKRVLSFAQALEIAEKVFKGDYQEYFSKRRLDLIPRQLRVSPIGRRYTVGHALQDYLTDKKIRSSRAGFNHSMADSNAYIVGELSSIPCDELQADQLRKWLHRIGVDGEVSSNFARQGHNRPIGHNDGESIRKAKLRANSVLITLKAALNMAWRDGKIENDAAWRRLSPYKNVKKARCRVLSKEEVDRLLAAARPDLRKLILGGLYTGCRAGELRELRPSNFDYESGRLFVHATKTGRSRNVVLSFEAISFFERITHGLGDQHPIFHKDHLQCWPKSAYTRLMRQASGQAELDPPAVFHDLRHTYASNLIMAGVSPFVIADQMGHADCTQIIKTYGHVSADFAVEQIRKRSPLIVASSDAVARTAKWHSKLNRASRKLERVVQG